MTDYNLEWLTDKVIEVFAFFVIGGLIAALFYGLFNIASLPPDEFFLVVAGMGTLALVILYVIRRKLISRKPPQTPSVIETPQPVDSKVRSGETVADKSTKITESVSVVKLDLPEISGAKFDSSLRMVRYLPQLEDLLSKATTDIRFMGVSVEYVLTYHRDKIEQLLGKGISMYFLLVRPDSDSAKNFIMMIGGAPNSVEHIKTSLATLKNIGQRHPDMMRVKVAENLPFHSLILVDNSFAQVGIYLHGVAPEGRPHSIVARYLQPEVFDSFVRSFRTVWEHATDVS